MIEQQFGVAQELIKVLKPQIWIFIANYSHEVKKQNILSISKLPIVTSKQKSSQWWTLQNLLVVNHDFNA